MTKEQKPGGAALERVAQWMIGRSYATGHGDTIEDMLEELEWQVIEKTIKKLRDELAAVESTKENCYGCATQRHTCEHD